MSTSDSPNPPVEHARRERATGTRAGRSGACAHGERGSATVTACFAVLALLAVTAMIIQLGATVTARHRVQSTADLAALAAAGALLDGPVAGCATADDLSTRAGTRLRECTVDQWDVTVVAELRIPLGLFGARFASAAARAGPMDEIE
ncbi:Rv3654c family TadE-like protein [Nocardia sp. NPDC050697]|uniref:Rv3654c family TadE-like protein n=1 Tax=Nocardia sp. NPDC050697 TaxID=3155158 RepID=UPI0033DD4589